MLSSLSRHVTCGSTLTPVRFIRARLRFSPTSDIGGEESDLEFIPVCHQSEKKKHYGRRIGPFDAPAGSIEVRELEGDQPLKEEEGCTRTSGKRVVQTIRSQKTSPKSRSALWKVHHLPLQDEVELSKYLRKHVIYADENLTVLNKPYGLTADDGDKVSSSVRSCLPVLSKMIYGLNSARHLILCNRLDKGTTGILVCATNKDTSLKVMRLFRQQKVRRKYWAITVGTPTPRQGLVDIPITLNHVEGDRQIRSHCRMALAPLQKLDYETGQMVRARQRNIETAETHYRTLDSHAGLALVEVQPFTSVKHQVRVHLSEALSCCILGDHKYSQTERLLPQRLPSSLLHRFGLRPTKSRNIFMHLHLREIVLPGVIDGSKPNLLISARAPEHFYKTLKLFKLKPGKETDFFYPSSKNFETTFKRNSPAMEELYTDPFQEQGRHEQENEVQRGDCYAVYKPKVKVKFRYGDSRE